MQRRRAFDRGAGGALRGLGDLLMRTRGGSILCAATPCSSLRRRRLVAVHLRRTAVDHSEFDILVRDCPEPHLHAQGKESVEELPIPLIMLFQLGGASSKYSSFT